METTSKYLFIYFFTYLFIYLYKTDVGKDVEKWNFCTLLVGI